MHLPVLVQAVAATAVERTPAEAQRPGGKLQEAVRAARVVPRPCHRAVKLPDRAEPVKDKAGTKQAGGAPRSAAEAMRVAPRPRRRVDKHPVLAEPVKDKAVGKEAEGLSRAAGSLRLADAAPLLGLAVPPVAAPRAAPRAVQLAEARAARVAARPAALEARLGPGASRPRVDPAGRRTSGTCRSFPWPRARIPPTGRRWA